MKYYPTPQSIMALSKKQSAVLYTTLIIALDQIIKEEFLRDLVARVYTWDDPAWHNLTLSFEATAAQTGAKPFHSPRTSFYLKTLPPQVLVSAVLVFLDLYWNAALEYVFPARPRGKEVSFEEKKDGGESLRDNDTPGKRSIVRGKPRRPSLSWRNTLVKWILDMSVGLVLHWTAFHIIHGIVYLEGFAATLEVVKKVSPIYLFIPPGTSHIPSHPTIFSPPTIL